jgi:hypothetical protein
MTEGQVIRFLLDRGFPIPSPAVLGKIGRDYVNRVNDYIADNEIATVRFVKGDVKEQIAREHFQRAEREGRYGVVMVGVAQEKPNLAVNSRAASEAGIGSGRTTLRGAHDGLPLGGDSAATRTCATGGAARGRGASGLPSLAQGRGVDRVPPPASGSP